MAAQGRQDSGTDQVSEAIATATQMAASAAKMASAAVQVAADEITGTTAAVTKTGWACDSAICRARNGNCRQNRYSHR
jgi:hypothetical protein